MDTKLKIAKLRFESKIKKTEGCHEWNGTLFSNGYGAFSYNRSSKLAHRMAWFFETGLLPLGVILHSCDNRKCVNVSHLKDGTQYENIHDMIDKGRRVIAYSENNGHAKLTYDQAEDIRNRYKTKQMTQLSLSLEYGINQSAVSRIIGNKIYTRPAK